MCFLDLFCTEQGEKKCLFVEIAKGGRRGSQGEPGKGGPAVDNSICVN